MVWLRLVQVLLHELRMALAMGILSRFLVDVFPPSHCLSYQPLLAFTLFASEYELIIHIFCLYWAVNTTNWHTSPQI